MITKFTLSEDIARHEDHDPHKSCCVQIEENGDMWVFVDGACFRTTIDQLGAMVGAAFRLERLYQLIRETDHDNQGRKEMGDKVSKHPIKHDGDNTTTS